MICCPPILKGLSLLFKMTAAQTSKVIPQSLESYLLLMAYQTHTTCPTTISVIMMTNQGPSILFTSLPIS